MSNCSLIHTYSIWALTNPRHDIVVVVILYEYYDQGWGEKGKSRRAHPTLRSTKTRAFLSKRAVIKGRDGCSWWCFTRTCVPKGTQQAISLYLCSSESIVRVEVKGHRRVSSQLKKPFKSLRPRLDTYWAKCKRGVFLISFYLPCPPNNRLLATFLSIITNLGGLK